ncbi:hypothetical protein BAC3_00946 [uncultured bacterium]|nr:hypothetical protein BAC3_00946 [uncultured bacterium]
MRSTLKKYSELLHVGRDAPGFFLYGLVDGVAEIKSWRKLEEIADIVRLSILPSRYPTYEFYHIGVPDVDAEHGEVGNVDRLLGGQIKGARIVIKGGDVIFARIEPSIYNRKTAIVPNLGVCLGSTEFLVARPKQGMSSEYILWVLRNQWVAQQVLGKMTGSTGRRRFEESDFAKLLIPWVEPDNQKVIARVLVSARVQCKKLIKEAAAILQQGDNVALDLIQRPQEAISNIADDEILEDEQETKWSSMDKLYLPSKGEGANQLTLDMFAATTDDLED